MRETPYFTEGVLDMLELMHSQERRFESDLTDDERADDGTLEAWGAKVVLAHVTDFKAEQAARVQAAASGTEPAAFPPIDHRDPVVFAGYVSRSWDQVRADTERVSRELFERARDIDPQILFTPGVYPWLRGRALWAQVLVRGVWHPSGHLHQYLAAHGHFDRVLELEQEVCSAATDAGIPDVPGGRPFALYNLACAHALAGETDPALERLAQALQSDRNLVGTAREDSDLDSVREQPRFAELVAARA